MLLVTVQGGHALQHQSTVGCVAAHFMGHATHVWNQLTVAVTATASSTTTVTVTVTAGTLTNAACDHGSTLSHVTVLFCLFS
jgi:hypothetical protein